MEVPKVTEGFVEVEFHLGDWSIRWVSLGEGMNGEYNPNDPDDYHHLRFDVFHKGEQVENGSYCSLAAETTPVAHLCRASEYLLKTLDRKPAHLGCKRLLEQFTHHYFSRPPSKKRVFQYTVIVTRDWKDDLDESYSDRARIDEFAIELQDAMNKRDKMAGTFRILKVEKVEE